tara:strand:- start:1715 stop:1978 length:264 start_codon:yes stop_codon:yes gene_type:complete
LSEVDELRVQLELAKSQIVQLNTVVSDLHSVVTSLNKKVKEISAVNEIILNVQQAMLEDVTFSTHQPTSKHMSIFTFGGNDDDDLPN